jgi:signal transduction histidine kinase
VAQECLRNIARHAGATEAVVILRRSADNLELVVKDNGKGFKTDRTSGPSGLGLASMEERVNLAGGCLVITSEPGCGVRVEARLPAFENAK